MQKGRQSSQTSHNQRWALALKKDVGMAQEGRATSLDILESLWCQLIILGQNNADIITVLKQQGSIWSKP